MHRTVPPLAPPRPAVNVDIGAPSVSPSAHTNRAGSSGEIDVVDDGTHAAGGGGVAALEWLAVTLGGDDVATGGTGARDSANDDALSDNDDNEPASVLEDILEAILDRQTDQCEDTACDEDRVDVSVGADADVVVCVGVHVPGVNLGVSLGVRPSCRFPPPHFPRLSGSPSEIWESYDLNYHLPS